MALSKPADELRLKAIELLNNLVAQGSDDDAQSGRRRLEASQPSVSSNVLASWQRRSSSESQRVAVGGRLEHRRYSDAMQSSTSTWTAERQQHIIARK